MTRPAEPIAGPWEPTGAYDFRVTRFMSRCILRVEERRRVEARGEHGDRRGLLPEKRWRDAYWYEAEAMLRSIRDV